MFPVKPLVEDDQGVDPISSLLEKMHIERVESQHRHQHHHQHIEAKHRMLTLYRDDAPGAYIPKIAESLPSLVDLELPFISRRDMKKLLLYPEPRRTATWIRMSFVACEDYIFTPSVLYRAYKGALEHLTTPHDEQSAQKTPDAAPSMPLLSPCQFSESFQEQIEGMTAYCTNGKVGVEYRLVVRGARARTEALTFPSTNRKRNLRQLQHYKDNGDLIFPVGDPEKTSTFSRWLAHDPIFMLPSDTKSPLSKRTMADTANPGGTTYYDGKGTEDAGFPGVSLSKTDLPAGSTRNEKRRATASERDPLSMAPKHFIVGATEEAMSKMIKSAEERGHTLTNRAMYEAGKADVTAQLILTHPVRENESGEHEGRVTKSAKLMYSLQAVLNIPQAASQRVGRKQMAMVVNLTHLDSCVQEYRSDASNATRNHHHRGTAEFFEKLNELISLKDYQRRPVHELKRTGKVKSKTKSTDDPKVASAATAPVPLTFMELASKNSLV